MHGFLDEKERYLAAGLMSGTSVDGVDAAIVSIEGGPDNPKTELLGFETVPYPDDVKKEIFELFNPAVSTVDRIGKMNFVLGGIFADAVKKAAEKAGISISNLDFAGSHGQTIFHAPELSSDGGTGYTVQIGEGAVIAHELGIPCVSDFRVADVAAGGQGAPLVPFSEYLIGNQYADKIIAFMKEYSIRKADAVATVTYLTAWSIADAYEKYIKPRCNVSKLIVGGGGSHNAAMMKYIEKEMSRHHVKTLTQDEYGFSSDAKEAVAFALLAYCTLCGKPNNLPSVTGADRRVVMGKISL